MSRLDVTGAARAGSQLQTQLYVNRRAEQLNQALRETFAELDGARIEWRSPLATDGYREYQDAAFLGAVNLDRHAAALHAFWPRGGPAWDALAVAHHEDWEQPGVVLVEGKSYADELFGSGCQASAPSRGRIEQALGQTQRWLGVQQEPARWCGRLYQSANRLAHLYWLREVLGVRAWLVHLLFAGDDIGPTNEQQWAESTRAADAELGLLEPVPGAGHVVLPAGKREELVGSAG